MAVKIVRQPNKIAIIGAPSSAAAFLPGSEKAPAALRAAGIVERLQSIGYEVTDLGDCAPRLFADDEEHKRARNIPEIVASLSDLKPRAEIGLKSGALVLVLGGDCTQIIALLTGARRYYKHVNLLWFDRDADLNTPASTPSGRLDGMVLASIIGKGSPELVRFWGEPPLVREPDTLIYGLKRVDPPEVDFLTRSPLRHVYAADISLHGAEKSAHDALAHLHADTREFMVHVDLDVIVQLCRSSQFVCGICEAEESAGARCRSVQSRQGPRWFGRKKSSGFARRSSCRAFGIPRHARSPRGNPARYRRYTLRHSLNHAGSSLLGEMNTEVGGSTSSRPIVNWQRRQVFPCCSSR